MSKPISASKTFLVLPAVCPSCRQEDPEIESLEWVPGLAQINIVNGEPHYGGYTEMLWDGQVACEYRWSCCGDPVGPGMADILDKELGNDRYSVHSNTYLKEKGIDV